MSLALDSHVIPTPSKAPPTRNRKLQRGTYAATGQDLVRRGGQASKTGQAGSTCCRQVEDEHAAGDHRHRTHVTAMKIVPAANTHSAPRTSTMTPTDLPANQDRAAATSGRL